MIKLSYENIGSLFVVVISGESKEEVLEKYYSLWNHEATNGELHWLNEPLLAYIISSEEKLKQALVNSCLFENLNKDPLKYKGKKSGALQEARQAAEIIFNGMTETDLYFKSSSNHEFFSISDCDIKNNEYDTLCPKE